MKKYCYYIFVCCIYFYYTIESSSQIDENLLSGYWVQTDYNDYNAKYKVQVGGDTVLSGGLLFENGKVNFLNGLFLSPLLFGSKDKKDKAHLLKTRSNYNNWIYYTLQDSTLFIENKLKNTYLPIKIKRVNNDTLILFSQSTNFEETYTHKSYSDSLKTLKINSIEYFSSVCLGKCPSIKVTILDNRNFTY